jgi:hypothetical protein
MVVLALTFHDGTYSIVQGHEVVEKSALPPSSDSFEWLLHRVGVPRFIVDLRGLYDGLPATSWLLDERPFRAIGSTRTPLEFLPTRVARDFDAIVYFDRAGASKLISE